MFGWQLLKFTTEKQQQQNHPNSKFDVFENFQNGKYGLQPRDSKRNGRNG